MSRKNRRKTSEEKTKKNQIRLYMDKVGYSCRTLEAATGIRFQRINDLENDRGVPDVEELYLLCKALNATPKKLYPNRKLREALGW